MLQRKSKAIESSWADLLRKELGQRRSKFPPNAKSFEEIRAELKKAGLSSGESYVYAYLKRLVKEGRAKRIDGSVRAKNGSLIRAIKYVLNP